MAFVEQGRGVTRQRPSIAIETKSRKGSADSRISNGALSPSNAFPQWSPELEYQYRMFLAWQQLGSPLPTRLQPRLAISHQAPPPTSPLYSPIYSPVSAHSEPPSSPLSRFSAPLSSPFTTSTFDYPVFNYHDSSMTHSPMPPLSDSKNTLQSTHLGSIEGTILENGPSTSGITSRATSQSASTTTLSGPVPSTVPTPSTARPTTPSTLPDLANVTTSPIYSGDPALGLPRDASSITAQDVPPAVAMTGQPGTVLTDEQYQMFLEWRKLGSPTVPAGQAESQPHLAPISISLSQTQTIRNPLTSVREDSSPQIPPSHTLSSSHFPTKRRTRFGGLSLEIPDGPPDANKEQDVITLESSPGTELPLDWDFNLRTGAEVKEDENVAGEAGNSTTLRSFESSAAELLEALSDILLDHKRRERLCTAQDDQAQVTIDYLYSVLLKPELPKPWLRRHCLIALYKLCKSSRLYPQCYNLKDSILVSDTEEDYGGFSDIRKGEFDEKEICLKVIRFNKSNLDAMLKRYAKEAILWGQLNHPNIAPLYGVYYLDSKRRRLCLVSPWMRYGNIARYLHRNPLVPRAPFVYDVVSGTGYLHELGLIHSDLKGANILVNDRKQACITDFGMSFIRTDKTLSRAMATTTVHGITQRWASPELLDSGARPTIASDIWALGCVCYEILTGKVPFDQLPDNLQIMKALLDGKVPTRPTSPSSPVENAIWTQAERCWAKDPADRPKCQELLNELRLAGIVREQDENVQREAERETRHFRNAIRKKRDDFMDVDTVRKVFSNLCGSVPCAEDAGTLKEAESQDVPRIEESPLEAPTVSQAPKSGSVREKSSFEKKKRPRSWSFPSFRRLFCLSANPRP